MTTPTVPFYPITHDDGVNISTALNNILSALNIPTQIIAEDFDSSVAYAVDDYVIYNGTLYRFNSAHSAGAWDPLDVDAVVVGSELKTKQDILTWDTTPTASSTNPVTSGGIKTAFDGLHKIYTSPSELGLSANPTMVAVAEAMPDGSIGIFTVQDIDISALTYNNEMNEIVIYRRSNIRIFAIASRTYNNVDFRNAQLYYASYSSTAHTFFGFKKVVSDNLYFTNQSTSVTSVSTAEFCRITDSRINTDTVVLNMSFSDSSYITSGISWSSAAGYISLKGICTNSNCKVNIVLGQKGN